jgi:CheY-like chemotaxis protein
MSDPSRRPIRVLIVDDDDLVREMLLTSLEHAGFIPFGVNGALDALALIDSGAELDAVVTDLYMPGMSGWDFVGELQARQPDLPTIMLTGHVGDLATHTGRRPAPTRFLLLQKPVTAHHLIAQLTALIASSVAGDG